MCGLLSDKAKQQSNWLLIEKGQMVVVRYLDFRFVPNKQDPSKEVVQYIVELDGSKKYWENASSRVMRVMDRIPKGSWISIEKGRWVNKDGIEDKQKSSYTVLHVDNEGNPVPVKDEAWDE